MEDFKPKLGIRGPQDQSYQSASDGIAHNIYGIFSEAFHTSPADVKKFVSQNFENNSIIKSIMEKILGRAEQALKNDKTLNTIVAKAQQFVNNFNTFQVDPKTIMATFLTTIGLESGFEPFAIANVTGSQKSLDLVNSKPEHYFKKYADRAKGYLQFTPSTYKLISQYASPIESDILEDPDVKKLINMNDTNLKLLLEQGMHYTKMVANTASQIIPSIKLLVYNVEAMSQDWKWDDSKGWLPRRKDLQLNEKAIWNLYPTAKNDKDLGFALLYTLYHSDGQPSLYAHPPVFHHGPRYKTSVETVGYLIHNDQYLSSNVIHS